MNRKLEKRALTRIALAALLIAAPLLWSGCGVSDSDLRKAGQETGKLVSQGAEKAGQFWQGFKDTFNPR